MTVAEYRRLLEVVSYKPGWHFVLRQCGGGFCQLEVSAPVIDSLSRKKPMSIAQTYSFNEGEFVNASRFYSFVRACAARVEQHEFSEFFRVDGRPWPTADHATF